MYLKDMPSHRMHFDRIPLHRIGVMVTRALPQRVTAQIEGLHAMADVFERGAVRTPTGVLWPDGRLSAVVSTARR